VTFKELQRLVQSLQSNPEQSRLLDRLRDKPFWVWSIEEHKQQDIKTKGDCCFNHILSLPKKNGIEKPFYDYQKTIFDSLQDYKHLWIKKATGLGIIEFMLRYMTWLCLKDNSNEKPGVKLYWIITQVRTS
jgi:hypothetical protein